MLHNPMLAGCVGALALALTAAGALAAPVAPALSGLSSMDPGAALTQVRGGGAFGGFGGGGFHGGGFGGGGFHGGAIGGGFHGGAFRGVPGGHGFSHQAYGGLRGGYGYGRHRFYPYAFAGAYPFVYGGYGSCWWSRSQHRRVCSYD